MWTEGAWGRLVDAMRTDAELIAAYAASRDEESFAEIASRHGAGVWRACARLLGDAHAAEDAAQAVFLVLARKAGSLRRNASLAAWLHGVARHVCLRALRERASRAKREEEAAMARAAEATGEVGGAERKASLANLDRALASLSPGQREAVVLRHLEGRSEREAAAIAGVPVGTLSRRTSDGLARLRKKLARRGAALGLAPLAALLAGEAQAAAPATLLPSILAVPKLAATGAAAGAAGGGVTILAEGAIRMMFWSKVKAAAVMLSMTAAIAVAVPVAGGLLGAAEPAEPVAPAEPAEKPAPPALKPEWKGKLLVSLAEKADRPVWSPDGTRVACCLKLKTEPGRGYTKVTEGGVGVVDMATGKLRKVSVCKGGPVMGLAWMPDGKRLVAAEGKNVWVVRLADSGLAKELLARLPADIQARGIASKGGLLPSPDGGHIVCWLKKLSFERDGGRRGRVPGGGLPAEGPDYAIVDAKGKQVALFEGKSPLWTPDGRAIFFNRNKELCRIALPGGKEETLFSSNDYFKGAPPKTHASLLWAPRPVSVLADGRFVVEIAEAAARPLGAVGGIVITSGEMVVCKNKGGAKAFARLGPTRHGLHGEIVYTPLGQSDYLLRVDTTKRAPGNNPGGTVMHLVDAATGKTREIKPVQNIECDARVVQAGAEAHGINGECKGQSPVLSHRLCAVSPDGDTVVFSASGRLRKPVNPEGTRFMSWGHWFGLFVLDVPSGNFKRVAGRPVLGKAPLNVSVAPSGKLITMSRNHQGGYRDCVLLCDPAGSGMILPPEKPKDETF